MSEHLSLRSSSACVVRVATQSLFYYTCEYTWYVTFANSTASGWAADCGVGLSPTPRSARLSSPLVRSYDGLADSIHLLTDGIDSNSYEAK